MKGNGSWSLNGGFEYVYHFMVFDIYVDKYHFYNISLYFFGMGGAVVQSDLQGRQPVISIP